MWRDCRVEGDCVVVRYGVTLPPRCVITNEPVDGDGVTIEVRYRPALTTLLTFVPPFVGLFLQSHCEVTCWLSPRVARQRAFWPRVCGAIAGAGLFASFAAPMAVVLYEEYGTLLASGGAWSGVHLTITGGFVVACLAAVAHFMVASRPLKVVRMRGGEFWVRGCGEAFLNSLRDEMYANGGARADAPRPDNDPTA